jgi:uncharacterized protein
MKRLLDYFSALGRKLLEVRDTPHAVAGGAAIGMFMGFTPLFGVKTLLSLLAAYLLRCSKIAAVIAVSLHDVIWPFLPFLLDLEYKVGYFLLTSPHVLPAKMVWKDFHKADLLNWTKFFEVGRPLMVGSLFVSAPAALLTYGLTLFLLKRREARRLKREADAHASQREQ